MTLDYALVHWVVSSGVATLAKATLILVLTLVAIRLARQASAILVARPASAILVSHRSGFSTRT